MKLSANCAWKLKACPDNPAYSCVSELSNSKHFEKSSLTPPLGLQILPLFEDSKIDLDWLMTPQGQIPPPPPPPLNQSEPQIFLSLTNTTNLEVYKEAFLEVMYRHPNYVEIFSNSSKVDEKVADAAVSPAAPKRPFSLSTEWPLFCLHSGAASSSVCS